MNSQETDIPFYSSAATWLAPCVGWFIWIHVCLNCTHIPHYSSAITQHFLSAKVLSDKKIIAPIKQDCEYWKEGGTDTSFIMWRYVDYYYCDYWTISSSPLPWLSMCMYIVILHLYDKQTTSVSRDKLGKWGPSFHSIISNKHVAMYLSHVGPFCLLKIIKQPHVHTHSRGVYRNRGDHRGQGTPKFPAGSVNLQQGCWSSRTVATLIIMCSSASLIHSGV